jgi:hypothetical protein
MKNFISSWWVPLIVLALFICVGLWIRHLAFWTILEYYKGIYHPDKFDTETTAQIGDTIGGTTGPLIALSAGFLTFIAFWAQLRANNQVNEQFKIQQFESQYFEMIRLHKENINEMKISGYSYLMATSFEKGKEDQLTTTRTQIERVVEGRKIFVSMVKELNACYEFCRNYAKGQAITQDEVYKLAYRFFFFGSFSHLLDGGQHQKFVDACRKKLKAIREKHKEAFGGIKDFTVDRKKVDLHIKYAPFTGHESRLSHYYRHFFSTVKFVVKKEKEGLFNYEQSREYLKILRAQMSNDEQILLYHNYISGMGGDWEKESNLFLSKYRMLHNLPVNRVRFVQPPREHFQQQIQAIEKESHGNDQMFEWGDEG